MILLDFRFLTSWFLLCPCNYQEFKLTKTGIETLKAEIQKSFGEVRHSKLKLRKLRIIAYFSHTFWTVSFHRFLVKNELSRSWLSQRETSDYDNACVHAWSKRIWNFYTCTTIGFLHLQTFHSTRKSFKYEMSGFNMPR